MPQKNQMEVLLLLGLLGIYGAVVEALPGQSRLCPVWTKIEAKTLT